MHKTTCTNQTYRLAVQLGPLNLTEKYKHSVVKQFNKSVICDLRFIDQMIQIK